MAYMPSTEAVTGFGVATALGAKGEIANCLETVKAPVVRARRFLVRPPVVCLKENPRGAILPSPQTTVTNSQDAESFDRQDVYS
jgi:hypothetical protein